MLQRRISIRTKLIRIVCIFSLLILLFNTISVSTFAQNNSDNKISLSPALIAISANPGEKKQFSTTLINNSKNDYDLEIQFLNIDINQYLNTGKLVYENNLDNPSVWLFTQTNQFKLPAGSKEILDFELQIPADINPKGYFPVIVYNYKLANAVNPALNLDYKLVTIIYLNVFSPKKVLGEESGLKNLAIVNFSPVDRVVFTPNEIFNLTYQNTGPNYIQPRGVIKIYDRTNKLLSSLPTVNDSFGYLVQDQQKSEVLNWQPVTETKLLPDFGEYTAVVEIYENPDQKVLVTAKTTFLVLPVWHILGLILLTIGGLYLLSKIKIKIRTKRVVLS